MTPTVYEKYIRTQEIVFIIIKSHVTVNTIQSSLKALGHITIRNDFFVSFLVRMRVREGGGERKEIPPFPRPPSLKRMRTRKIRLACKTRLSLSSCQHEAMAAPTHARAGSYM